MQTMKKRLFAISIAAVLALLAGPALAGVKGEVNLFYGMKDVKDSDFERIEFLPTEDFPNSILDVSSMTEYGLVNSFGGVEWPVMIAVDFLSASEDDAYNFTYYGEYDFKLKAELETMEIDLGVRKYWTNHAKFHPYIGGGVAWIDADAELALFGPDIILLRQASTEWFSQCASDSGAGYWLNAGVMWRITPRLSLGFDARYSDASVDFVFEGDEIPDAQVVEDTWKADVGGLHYGLLFGFRW